jgi:hypothetical protein
VQFQPGPGYLPYTTPKYVQVPDGSSFYTGTISVMHVFQFAPVGQPAQVYQKGGSGCQAVQVTNFATPMAWFSATEIAASTFVQGTTGIDP